MGPERFPQGRYTRDAIVLAERDLLFVATDGIVEGVAQSLRSVWCRCISMCFIHVLLLGLVSETLLPASSRAIYVSNPLTRRDTSEIAKLL